MTITFDVNSPVQDQLQAEAARQGRPLETVVREIVEKHFVETSSTDRETRPFSARELLQMSKSERDRLLRIAAEEAAPLYEADLARHPADRELTAFTALDGDEFHEYDRDFK